ncbi:MAG: hypothetical protein AAFY46_04165, partial [Planctomycetota bacterium]
FDVIGSEGIERAFADGSTPYRNTMQPLPVRFSDGIGLALFVTDQTLPRSQANVYDPSRPVAPLDNFGIIFPNGDVAWLVDPESRPGAEGGTGTDANENPREQDQLEPAAGDAAQNGAAEEDPADASTGG